MRAGIGHLDAIAARLIDVKEESLLDGVLVRPGLDVDAVLEENIGGEQYLLARVERVGDVMKAASRAGRVARVSEVVGLVGGGEPDAHFAAVIHDDAFGEAKAEVILEEL